MPWSRNVPPDSTIEFLLKVAAVSLGVSLVLLPWISGFDVTVMTSGQHIVYTLFFGLCIVGAFAVAVFVSCRPHMYAVFLPWAGETKGVTPKDA